MGVSGRTTSTRLFGAAIGICPFGGAAMVAYRGNLALARAVRNTGVPMILSAYSLIALEEVQPLMIAPALHKKRESAFQEDS